MVNKDLLAVYGQVSIELEMAQVKYNSIRTEIEKQIQVDREQAKIKEEVSLEPDKTKGAD